jgi:hypothetical protein
MPRIVLPCKWQLSKSSIYPNSSATNLASGGTAPPKIRPTEHVQGLEPKVLVECTMPTSIFCGSKDGVLVDKRYLWPIFHRLPLLLSEGASSELYRSRDSGQSTTIGQLGGLQHSAADAPKPTTSPASSSRPFDCLLLCFKAILPHLLDLQQQLGR